METGGHPEGDRPPLPPLARATSPATLPTPFVLEGRPCRYTIRATLPVSPLRVPLRQASSFPRVSFQRVILTRPAPAQGA